MEPNNISKTRNIIEWILCILVAVSVAILFRYYIGTPTQVKSISMQDTLIEGQILLLNKYSFRVQKELPKRGEIVIFESPKRNYHTVEEAQEKEYKAIYDTQQTIIEKFFYQVLEIGKQSYIKRVIALEGEHVQIKDGKVYVNEEELEENYVKSGIITTSKCITEFTVPKDYVFVMGDNRSNSMDAREFGCIPIEKIQAKVGIRIWPFSQWGEV